MRRLLLTMLLAVPLCAHALTPLTPELLAGMFEQNVKRRYTVPPEAEQRYLEAALQMLGERGAALDKQQLLTVVDRSPNVQALLLYAGNQGQGWKLVGASPVSTGRTRQFDHYITPIGVYDHAPSDYSDFRAEGTRNENGIKGYGNKGRRVWDLGWFTATKGWGKGESGNIRLQLHATDPERLEPKLGTPASKGCIRVSGSLNDFLDHYGALDSAIEDAARAGKRAWVLRRDRETELAGRYLVVLDSQATGRPEWAQLASSAKPGRPEKAP